MKSPPPIFLYVELPYLLLGQFPQAVFARLVPLPFPLRPREFTMRDVFKVEANGDTSVAVATTSARKKIDYGFHHNAVKAQTRAIWRFKNLPNRAGVKQCRVVLTQFVDLCGAIPVALMSRKAPEVLSVVQTAIDLFRKDEEVDAVNRSEYAKFIAEKGEEQVYSRSEVRS